MLKTSLGRFRLIAFIEGISYILLLLIGVPLKRFAHIPEPNMVLGTAHGILFVLYILLLVPVAIELSWSAKKVFWAFVASLIPLGTFYADKKLFRQ